MPIDGILINKLSLELQKLTTGRINKINSLSDRMFIFTIRVNRENINLLISTDNTYPYVCIANKEYSNNSFPTNFCMFLRKHLLGMFVLQIEAINSDRILKLTLQGLNEIKDEVKTYLYIELMGRHSNMIITDEDNTIIDCLIHMGISENKRTLLPKAIYTIPSQEKLNIFSLNQHELEEALSTIDSPKDISSKFNGFSTQLASYLYETNKINKNILNSLNNIKPVFFKNVKNKLDLYYFPISNNIVSSFETMSSMIETFFYNRQQKEQISQSLGNIEHTIIAKKKKLLTKIDNLNIDLDKTNSREKFKKYGELLLQVQNKNEKSESINVLDYYENKYIDIELDNKLNIIQNSQKFYKTYQKLKNSISHIQEQIKFAESEIEYFDLILEQLKHAKIDDVSQIKEELIDYGYLKGDAKKKKKSKHQKFNILSYSAFGSNFYVGKNNIQNDYITHTLANSKDIWFHAKDVPGSHVIVKSNNERLDEKEIRFAANLAAYFSKYQNTSSAPINYTQIKNLKKVPGKKNCFVTMKEYKTIYIDPEEPQKALEMLENDI